MNPPAGPALVCHVLLVETDGGLVLVDSGYGLRDIEDPARRIGPIRHLRPVIRLSKTPPYWSRPPVPLGTHPPAWP